MKKIRKFKKSPPKSDTLTEVEQNVENLQAYDRFQTEVSPELRKMLAAGASSKDIMKKFSSFAAARLMTIAMASGDEKSAIIAARDILDRVEGRATETKRLEHSLAAADDRDLDALLKSEMAELENMDNGEDDEEV